MNRDELERLERQRKVARDDLLAALDAELVRFREPPREPRLRTWLWRLVFALLIGLLLIVSTTEKSADDTTIEPCALVLTDSGQRCR